MPAPRERLERTTRAWGVAFALLLTAPVLAIAPAGDGIVIHRREHLLDVGGGVVLHVVEKWSDRSEERTPRRAVLMVTATLVTEKQWDSDVPGDPSFNSLDRAAREGFFAYTFTYDGYPGSPTQPADGHSVTFERLLPEAGAVLEFARARSGAAQVDLVGSSLGSSIAVALGSTASPIPREHVGRLALTAHVYKDVTPIGDLVIGPVPCTMFTLAPQGYQDTPPMFYLPILFNAEPAAQLWGYQTFPGHYAIGPTEEGCHLPVFDVNLGRAPALLFWGDRDLVSPLSDLEQACADYGGPCAIANIPGLGHAPNFEPIREAFWARVWVHFG